VGALGKPRALHIPLAPQLEWLAEAGFVDVDVFLKRLDWGFTAAETRTFRRRGAARPARSTAP
jgi:hypothetical protein